jgi:adenylate cyclase
MEIERKFLVTGDFKSLAHQKFRITQGYLSSVPERSVRIRLRDNKGFITIKGKPNTSGSSRYEWEKEITEKDAIELLEICEPGVIDKIRYLVKFQDHLFEVDEFFGDNKGLILAEIELTEEDEVFSKPSWLGQEVTGDERFYNSMLIKHPFTSW